MRGGNSEVNPGLSENFNALPTSHKRNYIGWILDAKKDETRQRRIVKLLEMLEKNIKPGML